MKLPKSAVTISCLVVMLLSNLLQAQTTSSQDALNSVRKFVQEFYGWYVPKALKFDDTTPASGRALKDRAYVFSPELFKALKEDSDAQARAHELVGLDFDPFLCSQDPAERYELGRISQKGNSYLIDVFGVYPVRPPDRPEGLPDVIAEVARRNGRWVFTNFLYPPIAKRFPDTANLLATLMALKEDRRKSNAKHSAD